MFHYISLGQLAAFYKNKESPWATQLDFYGRVPVRGGLSDSIIGMMFIARSSAYEIA